jgi:RNA polymerase sigma-70 factor (ECF subfamily)
MGGVGSLDAAVAPPDRPPGEADEAALVAGLRRRDPRAFDAVYARFRGRLWSFLVRLAGRRDVAEDLFQDTWLLVARHAERLEDGTDLRAWLFTVARNRYRSYRRWSVLDLGRLDLFGREPMPEASGPEGAAAARAEVAAVEEALRALPAAHREVLLLAGVEGLDSGQVAAVLGIRDDAARKRLSRARAELAARLEKRDAQERPGALGGSR